MGLTTAFWFVFHKIFKWRPVVLGCCDCGASYYLTKNKVIRKVSDETGDSPVIDCPYCGLEHLVLLVRLDANTVAVRYESVYEEDVPNGG